MTRRTIEKSAKEPNGESGIQHPLSPNRRQPVLDDVAKKRMVSVVGVTRERLAGWLNVKVLAETARGDGMEAVLDEFHRVGMCSKGFGGRWLVSIGSSAQRQQRTESGTADAEAMGQRTNRVPGFTLDVSGAHNAGERELPRIADCKLWTADFSGVGLEIADVALYVPWPRRASWVCSLPSTLTTTWSNAVAISWRSALSRGTAKLVRRTRFIGRAHVRASASLRSISPHRGCVSGSPPVMMTWRNPASLASRLVSYCS